MSDGHLSRVSNTASQLVKIHFSAPLKLVQKCKVLYLHRKAIRLSYNITPIACIRLTFWSHLAAIDISGHPDM